MVQAQLEGCDFIRLCLANDVVYNVLVGTLSMHFGEQIGGSFHGEKLHQLISVETKLVCSPKEGWSLTLSTKLSSPTRADLHTHARELNKLICHLAICGVKIDDKDQAVLFLRYVKYSHKHYLCTILYW